VKRSEIKRRAPLKASRQLQRKTPLQSSKPLEAKTPLARSSVPLRQAPIAQKRPKPAVTPKVRAQLRQRSGGLCEIWLHGICAEQATEASHRIKRGAGGRHGAAAERNGRASNLTYSCSPCHAHIHARPEVARHWGWMLLESADPLTSPVLIRGQWSLLTDDGRVVPV
jgi:5-methylcytosine-specific restriction enzyme A